MPYRSVGPNLARVLPLQRWLRPSGTALYMGDRMRQQCCYSGNELARTSDVSSLEGRGLVRRNVRGVYA